MDIVSFAEHISTRSESLRMHSVIYITGAEYPILLLRWLCEQLAITHAQKLTSYELDATNLSSMQGRLLSNSLFGTELIMLTGFPELHHTKKKVWHDFFRTYTGPHQLVVYDEQLPKNVSNTGLIVECKVPDTFAVRTCMHVLSKHLTHMPLDEQFLQSVTKHVKYITWDQVWLFLRYGILLGKNNKLFIDRWLPQLISVEQSLFTLAQFLFARDTKQFMSYWITIEQQYTPIFWTHYWSDIIWRAAVYRSACDTKNADVLKRTSVRLPFNYIKTDWRKHTIKQLHRLHDDMLRIDQRIKNGFEPLFDAAFLKFLKAQ